MTKTIQSTVAFTDPQNNPLANGLLILDLNQASEVSSGGGQVAPMRVAITLDSSGKIPANTSVFANDELNPSGTAYRAKLYNSNLSLVADFGFWSIVGASPIDLSQEVATSLNVAYPTAGLLNVAGTWTATQTFNSGKLVATSPTLTSPTINGTPTGTGIATIVGKKGTGNGTDYTTTSTSMTDVDATNLSYTVTIPIGWKLFCVSSGTATNDTANDGTDVQIIDGSTVLHRASTSQVAAGGNLKVGWSLNGTITGDGASHTIKLQFCAVVGGTAHIINTAAGNVASMVFELIPSN